MSGSISTNSSISGTVDINIDRVGAGSISVAPVISKDHFAMAAMQALLSHPLEALQIEYATYQLECPAGKDPLEMVDWLADRAFQLADAMERRRYK